MGCYLVNVIPMRNNEPRDRDVDSITYFVGTPIIFEPFVLKQPLGARPFRWIFMEASAQEVLK
jgi:hypothetical protein